jgi:hypothetical protein
VQRGKSGTRLHILEAVERLLARRRSSEIRIADVTHESDAIVVNGRRVLREWRKARPGEWNLGQATEYSRSVAALLRVLSIAREVADALSE